MPDMTLTEAAEWAGVGRPTIHKALTGKLGNRQLSGRQDEKRQWWINPAELARVFEPASAKGTREAVAAASPVIEEVIAGNGREIALLREMIDRVTRECDDLRKDRDQWREQAASQTLMLTHQAQQVAIPTSTTALPAAAAASARPGFLARLKAVVAPPP